MKKTACLGFSLFLIWAIPGFAQTPAPAPPAVGNLYRAWFNEKDPAKKTELAEQFITNADPAFKASQYLPYLYQQVFTDYAKAQNWTKVMDLADKLPTLVPNADNTLKTTVFTQAMGVANQNDNAAKTVEYGDKLLGIDPANLNALMFVPPAILSSLPAADPEKTAALTKARDYARKMLAAPKPKAVGDADWAVIQGQARFTVGLSLLARNAYTEAITEFQEAVKLNKNDDQSHYNMGLAYSALLPDAQTKVIAAYDEENAAKTALKPQAEIDEIATRRTALETDFNAKRDLVIDAFARAAALAGPTAVPARAQFERLYKQKNPEATAEEMNTFIAQKKAN